MIAYNYLHFQNSANSYDYYDNDDNANPGDSVDSHGTSCAGEIAMVKSNGYCGVGVAYESQLAGRYID